MSMGKKERKRDKIDDVFYMQEYTHYLYTIQNIQIYNTNTIQYNILFSLPFSFILFLVIHTFYYNNQIYNTHTHNTYSTQQLLHIHIILFTKLHHF